MGRGALTSASHLEGAALPGVATRLVCHVDGKAVISHEGVHVHVARVRGVCGIVAGPVQAAEGDLVLQFHIRVLPWETEMRSQLEASRAQCSGLGGLGWGHLAQPSPSLQLS